MKINQYDFSGWATKAGLKCSDGRTILKGAFKHNDGAKVPLVWQHQHNDPGNILGSAYLEHREEGVYVYGVFNDSENGQLAKQLVQSGNIEHLSIFANKLQESKSLVQHGDIKEVSLVLSGANPGALIDVVMAHSDEPTDEATIYTQETIELYHADSGSKTDPAPEDGKAKEEGKTVQDVIDGMTDEQRTVMYALVGEAMDQGNQANIEHSEGGNEMKKNVFDGENNVDDKTLSHAEIAEIFANGKRNGSLKESVLAHGIEDIEFLFPDATNLDTTPQFIQREMTWVDKVMNGVHKTPFSRIKSVFADITEAEARAKGYIKGKLKVEEVFSLLKRTTSPTTIYKKQKIDRDDVVDITDFDVVAWIKMEMRMMLNEEIARAILVGDGRLGSSDDKIKEDSIRPIWKDDALFTVKALVNEPTNATDAAKAKGVIGAVVRSRKNYKGSGSPVFFTTEDLLTECLLLEDTTGRVIYDSVDKLATAMRVKEIITVPVMEGLSRESGTDVLDLMGIIVNLADYNVGADKGGAVNLFDDFDIDYNAQKYLIETRCSGALTKPFSAVAIEWKSGTVS